MRSREREYWERRALRSSLELEPCEAVFAERLSRVATGKSVLDLGSGIGALSAALKPAARRVVGVDFSAPVVRRARALVPGVTFHHMDLLAADLGERFDIICGVAVLHEIPPERTPALIEVLERHLAPGGFCWFQENSYFNPMARLVRAHVVGRFGVPKYGSDHERPFDRERWAMYRRAFPHATRSAEAFVLWQRVWTYLIRRGPYTPWLALDTMGSHLPDVLRRHLSYIQHIYLSRDVPKRLALPA